MDYRQSPSKGKPLFLPSINFILWLVILFCANYIYIKFLFK
jgi:hypothetical protein